MRIAARLWFWAAILRPVKHVLPLATLVRLVHRAPGARRNDMRVQRVEHALQRTGRAPRRPPANCLERSLGAYRMLCEAGAAPQIVVGIRRGAGTRVEGHVWVVVEVRARARLRRGWTAGIRRSRRDAAGCLAVVTTARRALRTRTCLVLRSPRG